MSRSRADVPDHLRCGLCARILRDPVTAMCCYATCCRGCFAGPQARERCGVCGCARRADKSYVSNPAVAAALEWYLGKDDDAPSSFSATAPVRLRDTVNPRISQPAWRPTPKYVLYPMDWAPADDDEIEHDADRESS